MRRNIKDRKLGTGLGTGRTILVVAGLMALSACTSTSSGLTTVYYKVPGTTVEQINEQIARRGPQNGHAIGTTETKMTPKVKTVREGDTCRIESADIDLDLLVTLPEWSELNRADGRTRSAFEALSRHVVWHEQQHVEISKKHSRLIEEALVAIPPQKTCRQLMTKARMTFRTMFEQHNNEQRAFDAAEREAIERRLRSLGYLS
ncbi:DUF922 domain-containing protein [Hoeflea prorocentri]|uniref:DUF922 domain-containing protein n=1 Tax=Hoeflea prorocentri TaxID=1922333 RepID=A0A9X3ZGQ7_9HYPH|nr:DUF922 domain-containing protein [Hoeflea prorocentri]MCY6380056.1 DUF922 domain-containing protein [Hoeflea prorocentri]MDA5397856.1 DUF922 domain-containing protein [Hoeflea prorocentri]